MQSNRILKITITCALATLTNAALAQTPSNSTAELEGVIVTGTYIRGAAEDAALPVNVITSDDLAKQGSPSMLDLIKSLPNVGPVFGETNQFSAAAQGSTGVGNINLRGLGAQRTLVLLNGRRVVNSAAGGMPDTNMIPMAAIGRVEVLKDGAAATYGSDAIGGVVNFITRNKFQGLELNADYRYVDGSDGDYDASALYGWRGANGDLLFSAGYQHRSELSTTKRDWANRAYTVNPSGWSVLGNPGAYAIRAGATTVGFTRDANCASVGGFVGFTGNTPACYFTYVPFDNLVEKTDRLQLYGEANSNLSDAVKLHVEASYGKSELPDVRFSPAYPPTSGPNGPGSVNVYIVPSANPGFNTFLTQTNFPALIGTATGALMTLWRPLGNGGNPSTGGLGGQSGSRFYDTFRVSGGLNGDLSDSLHWDTALTYSRSTATQRTTDILIDRLQRALNGLGGAGCNNIQAGTAGSTCQWYNPFSNAYAGNPALRLTNPGYVPANANDPALVAWLFDAQDLEQMQTLLTFDAVLSGETGWRLPGGAVAWAAGGQHRRSEFRTRINSDYYDKRITPCPVSGVTTCAFQTGPYYFLGQAVPSYLRDTVYAAFAEFTLPLLDNLNAQLAARYEDYGGLTGNTFNPKLSMKYQIVDALAVRLSYGTTFRGPTAANRSPTGPTALSGIQAAGNNFKSVDTFGNPAVGPETATTANLGFLFKFGEFNASVDLWDYKLDDQIALVPANVIATAVAGVGNGSQLVNCSHPLRDLITFNNNNACTQGVTVGNDIARVRSDTTNGPSIKTRGVDISADYRAHAWSAGANISYVNKYQQDAFFYKGTFVSAGYEAAGFTNYDRLPGTISKWRGNVYGEYSLGAHNVRLVANYIGSAEDNRGPTTVQTGASTNCTVANAQAGVATNCTLITLGATVDAFVSFDLHYRLQLPWETTVTASIVNLADRDPSEARIEYSYDPYIGNPLGRTIKVAVGKKF